MSFSSKFLFLAALWLLSICSNMLLVVDAVALNGTCLNATQVLLQDPNLVVAQSVIFQDYNASYNDACSLGLSGLGGCDISFQGDERTYTALCESKGGQLYKRPVVLSCALGAIKYDLGQIPTCVGASCNITDVQPADVITDQVQSFLDNLTFTGCAAEGAGEGGSGSSSTTIIGSGLLLRGFSAVLLAPMVLSLWVGISTLFGN
jgi:hypothetical protein